MKSNKPYKSKLERALEKAFPDVVKTTPGSTETRLKGFVKAAHHLNDVEFHALSTPVQIWLNEATTAVNHQQPIPTPTRSANQTTHTV